VAKTSGAEEAESSAELSGDNLPPAERACFVLGALPPRPLGRGGPNFSEWMLYNVLLVL
jgi:hypothetical protein